MSETLTEILRDIHKVRTMSVPHLYRYLKTLGIRPVGARQRPQRYPDGTSQKVLEHLGLAEAAVPLPTMTELRAERSKARRRAA